MAVDGAIVGVIGVSDAIRPEAHDVVHELRHMKIKEIAVLTGDRAAAAKAVAKRVHADTFEAGLLPEGKARWIEERSSAGRRVAMVGDGINDAPALAAADAGIALGCIGADLAAEAGDLIVLGEPLRSAAGTGRPGPGHRCRDPPEHHRFCLWIKRRGHAGSNAGGARAGGGRDPAPGRLVSGLAQCDAAAGIWRLGRTAAISRVAPLGRMDRADR